MSFLVGFLILLPAMYYMYKMLDLLFIHRVRASIVSILDKTGQQMADGYFSENFAYYRILSEREKREFIFRAEMIARYKDFDTKQDLLLTDEMIMLVCGLWVQLTFGLKNFLSIEYQHIRIYPAALVGGSGNEYMGTTDLARDEMRLSYKHLKLGIKDATDRFNPGLYFFARILLNDPTLYNQIANDYAAWNKLADNLLETAPREQLQQVFVSTNFNSPEELWEVCVEVFFENPAMFSQVFPKLYALTCKVLRQDTLQRMSAAMVPEQSGA